MALWDDLAGASEAHGEAAPRTASTHRSRRGARAMVIAAVGAVLVVALWGSLSLLAESDSPRRTRAEKIVDNRETLRHLGAQFELHELVDGAPVPDQLLPLSRDGRLHVESDYLYISVWQDWRAERGTGIAYFPSPPDLRRLVPTAAGDDGVPTRDLGDGWWVIE